MPSWTAVDPEMKLARMPGRPLGGELSATNWQVGRLTVAMPLSPSARQKADG